MQQNLSLTCLYHIGNSRTRTRSLCFRLLSHVDQSMNKKIPRWGQSSFQKEDRERRRILICPHCCIWLLKSCLNYADNVRSKKIWVIISITINSWWVLHRGAISQKSLPHFRSTRAWVIGLTDLTMSEAGLTDLTYIRERVNCLHPRQRERQLTSAVWEARVGWLHLCQR